MRFEFKGGHFDFPPGHCAVFGILNVTPDSFSDGGQFISPAKALEHALRLEKEGADVLDIGGESTRPGARSVSADQEIERIRPVIRLLKQRLRIPISVDTSKAEVAEAALAEGAAIVNDISSLSADSRMGSVVAASGAGLILMHRRGTPETMQNYCEYQDLVAEVRNELRHTLQQAQTQGISTSRIAIDPGIGFAKTPHQNLILLHHLRDFHSLKLPIMIGVSRKSFLGGTVDERGAGTLAAELWAHTQGVQMIRTHDAGATRRALSTWLKINRAKSSSSAGKQTIP